MKLALILFCVVIAGCAGEPRFDTRNTDTVSKSMEAMSAKLAREDKFKLFAVFSKIVTEASMKALNGKDADGTAHLKQYHGMTAKELFAKVPLDKDDPLLKLKDDPNVKSPMGFRIIQIPK